MCGILGIISNRDVVPRLIDGLRLLEYRGYDSAGIATISGGVIERRRSEGKLIKLANIIKKSPIHGTIGIGHTRWATHGKPSAENAHPHMSDDVAVVHNGIIENFQEIRLELEEKGHVFTSETDSEVIVHLITEFLSQTQDPLKAVSLALPKLEGAFAIAVLFKNADDRLIIARKGSPLVIGYGQDEMIVGSDAIALSPWTQTVSYLEEGDYAEIRRDGAFIFDRFNRPTERALTQTLITQSALDKDGFKHFMLKEIFEQPTTIANTTDYFWGENGPFDLSPIDWNELNKLTIIACGTSYYAAKVAKYWFESLAKLSCETDIASEYRYRDPLISSKDLIMLISQSGETIDTLAAQSLAKGKEAQTISIVNVASSTMARESTFAFQIQAGPEIGVASTKAFSAQLIALISLAIDAGSKRGALTDEAKEELIAGLRTLPILIKNLLDQDQSIQDIARELTGARDVLYLGRGLHYPIALEGALKLKEISYIHAEGYPAGELKHGPIALVDSITPVVAIAPSDKWFQKTISNLKEVSARGGHIICLTDQKGATAFEREPNIQTFIMPDCHKTLTPILYSLPIQLIAYYVGLMNGTDVDQPRNLAKSVTVE